MRRLRDKFSFFIYMLGASLAFAPPARANGAQLGSLANATTGYQAAQRGMQQISTNQIGTGQGNVNQGQSTQNQAQMLTGAMQIASGLLGLLGAAAAGQKANQSGENAQNLSGLSPYSPPPSFPGESGGKDSVDLSPEGLRKGVVGSALSTLEKNYGIPRDQFVEALKAGVDPKAILSQAPKNTPSPALLQKVADSLVSNAGADPALDSASKLSASGASSPKGSGDSAVPTPDSAAPSAGARTPASHSPAEELNLESLGLSPEVKAALQAKADQAQREKETQKQNQEMHTWSLFQLVHSRYQKLETMLYGRMERTNSGAATAIKE